MSGIAEFNELKRKAQNMGINIPKGTKRATIEKLIEERTAELIDDGHYCSHGIRIGKCSICDADDPFDEIDPEIEGDHLVSEEVPEAAKAIDETLNRETWLNRAVHAMAPLLAQSGAVIDADKIRVSVGFGPRRKALGVCFPTKANNAGQSHMFISPVEDDALKILATLAHECIHSSDDCVSGHQGHFAKCARALGLEGKLTATVAGEGLNHALGELLEELGPYPHTKLNLSGIKKQGTRGLKVECPVDGFKFRTTQKWIDEFEGKFTCPCGSEMEVA